MRLYKFVPAAISFLSVLFLVAAPSARAQYHFGYSQPRDIDITGFAGGRFFGKIDLPNDQTYDYLKIDDNYDYGVMGDIGLFGPLQAEVMWSRQPTSFERHSIGLPGGLSPAGNVTLDNIQFSLLYQMGDSAAKFHPYFGGGIGFTHWNASAGAGLPFNNTVGFNLGGGVKYYFVKHIGARIDFRWLPTRTTSQIGQVCYYFYCYPANVNNYAQQISLNAGLIFRF
jgi:opacity protein-like surface antigen